MTAPVLDEGYAATLNAAGHTGEPDEFVHLLVDTCRRVRSTAIHLGVLELAREPTAALLARLAEIRRTRLYGFRLGARLVGSPTEAHAILLRAAGVGRVECAFDPTEPGEDPELALLSRVEAVVPLHEEGIEVAWHLPSSTATAASQVATAALLPLLHHLPPPVEPEEGVPQAALAVAAWREAHMPRTLTYGRGPGFVRILDRREPDMVVTFVTLDGAQARVFLAADSATPAGDLACHAPGVPVEAVTRFLDRLVERRLLCCTMSGRYQRLPIRRQMEERWVEGDS